MNGINISKLENILQTMMGDFASLEVQEMIFQLAKSNVLQRNSQSVYIFCNEQMMIF
jgi:hypothetical protein